MIHFTCEHCRKSVRVDDRYGGKMGRCPHCKQTVAIPPAANDALAALTAAISRPRAQADDTDHASVPPPPPAGGKTTGEELVLPEGSSADLADTVIIPAGAFAEKEEFPQASSRRGAHGTALERHRPALNIVRTILILVAVVVVLIVAVVGFALITRRF